EPIPTKASLSGCAGSGKETEIEVFFSRGICFLFNQRTNTQRGMNWKSNYFIFCFSFWTLSILTILGFVVLQQKQDWKSNYAFIGLFFGLVAFAVCGLLSFFDRSIIRESEERIEETCDEIAALQT